MNGPLHVADLVTLLKAIPADQFTPSLIHQELAQVRIDHASLEKYLLWETRGYTRNLIYRDDTFELLALCWDSGACSTIHNHAGQECWVHIHRGALCLDDFELADPAQAGVVGDDIIVRRTTRLPRAGAGLLTHKGPEDDIHRVVNPRSFESRAVSLHVYARPFDNCIIYDTKRPRARRIALSYYSIEGLLA